MKWTLAILVLASGKSSADSVAECHGRLAHKLCFDHGGSGA